MKRVGLIFATFIFSTIPISSDAIEKIDVLVAVSSTAVTGDAAIIAGQLQGAMNLAMSRSNMSSRQFRFGSYLLIAAYPDSGATTPGPALNFVVNDVDGLLTAARDNASFTVRLGEHSCRRS